MWRFREAPLRAAALPKFEGQRKVPRLLASKKLCFRLVQDASFTLFFVKRHRR